MLAFSTLFNQVNQIGTVTESIEAVKMAKQADWGVMTSHRRSATMLDLQLLQ
jgi:enolase